MISHKRKQTKKKKKKKAKGYNFPQKKALAYES